MPAKGHVSIEKMPAQIVTWLREHPGDHRTRDVADGLGVPPGMPPKVWVQKVGNALGRLARDGTVTREFLDIGHKKPVGHYSVKD